MADKETLERLSRLEASAELRWDNHDLNSEKMRESVEWIREKLSDLPCRVNDNRIKSLERGRRVVFGSAATLIVSVVAGVIVYFISKMS